VKHLNFKYKDRAVIKNMHPEIDGTGVIIIGVASRYIIDSYIVEFADGLTRKSFEEFGQESIEYRALVLSERCLECN